MASHLSCAFLLLVFFVHPLYTLGAGEYCHGWSDTYNTWHRGFHCPERYDDDQARYCCGTCSLRYCCTAAEARLDQSTCEQDPLYDIENKDKVKKMNPNMPPYLPFVIVVSAFLSFVLVGAAVSVCCCQCVKPKAADRQAGPVPAQTSLLEHGAPSPESTTPSRSSNTDSTAGTNATAARPHGSEVMVNMYSPLGNVFPGTHSQGPAQFYQPYLNYSLPPEHTMLMTPAFLDSRSVFGQSHGQPFPQAAMHTEPIYPTAAI